jgi:large subunit ribosomal protein L25
MQTENRVSFTLNAEPRDAYGKGPARKARRSGKIPAVVYRAGIPSQSLLLQEKELSDGLRANQSRNVLVAVQDNGKNRTCLVRQVQRHPVSRNIEHVDLYEVESSDSVTVQVPLVATGRAVGVRAGGLLRLLVRNVSVRCSPLSIPSSIEIDVTDLDAGKFIKASQLKPGAGITVTFARDYNVVTVEGKRLSKEEAAREAAAAAAAAKPAAKAAAKPAAKAAAPAAKAAPKK